MWTYALVASVGLLVGAVIVLGLGVIWGMNLARLSNRTARHYEELFTKAIPRLNLIIGRLERTAVGFGSGIADVIAGLDDSVASLRLVAEDLYGGESVEGEDVDKPETTGLLLGPKPEVPDEAQP